MQFSYNILSKRQSKTVENHSYAVILLNYHSQNLDKIKFFFFARTLKRKKTLFYSLYTYTFFFNYIKKVYSAEMLIYWWKLCSVNNLNCKNSCIYKVIFQWKILQRFSEITDNFINIIRSMYLVLSMLIIIRRCYTINGLLNLT